MAALGFALEYDRANAFNELLDFEDAWFGRLDQRNRTRPATFLVSLWNCFKYVSENISRTNSSVKGWHNGFVFTLNASHPTM